MDLKGLIVKVEYFTKNKILFLLKIVLFKKVQAYRSGKILIFRTGSIGDSICALPSLNSIRKNFPEAEISLLTNPGGKNVSIEFLLDPKLNFRIINYLDNNLLALYKNLRTHEYEMFIELPQTFQPFLSHVRNMIFAKALGVKIGFGWEIFATKTFKRYQESNYRFLPVRDRYLNLLKVEGLKVITTSYPLAITEQMQNKVFNLLNSKGLINKSKNIAVVAGAKRSTNRWPIDYFTEVIKHFTSKNLNWFLIGSVEDGDLVRPLLTLPNVYNFCGDLIPLESGVLLSYCSVTLSNDTGPMHISYAIGTPVISLFSARDYPYQWYPPLDGRNKIFRSFEEPCSPCLLEQCPLENACMKRIKPGQIISALKDLLGI